MNPPPIWLDLSIVPNMVLLFIDQMISSKLQNIPIINMFIFPIIKLFLHALMKKYYQTEMKDAWIKIPRFH